MKPEATEWQGTAVRRRFIVGRAVPGFHVATVFSDGAWALFPDADGQAIDTGESGGEAACDAAAVEHADKLRWRLPGTPARTAPSVAAAAVLTDIHARYSNAVHKVGEGYIIIEHDGQRVKIDVRPA